jgi:hypothetical protein
MSEALECKICGAYGAFCPSMEEAASCACFTYSGFSRQLIDLRDPWSERQQDAASKWLERTG